MRASPFSADVAIVRFALEGLRRVVAPPPPSGLSYVADSPFPILILLLVVGIPPDFFVRHLLVPHQYLQWNLMIDALAIASSAWLSGAFGSMAAMPHVIANGRVRFNLGLLGGLETDARNIASIEPKPDVPRRRLRATSRETAMLLVPGTTAVRVDFAEPVELRTYPLFQSRPVSSVYVGSDRPNDLKATIEREAHYAIRVAP